MVLFFGGHRNGLKQRELHHSNLKRGVKWKRRNYDLHNVLGFYVVIPAIFVTITGLIMAYEVLESFTQKTFGGVPAVEARKLSKKYEPPFVEGKDFITMQDAIDITRIRHPKIIRYV